MRTAKWIVKIPAPLFMMGLHRFKSKKAALAFLTKWLELDRAHMNSEGVNLYKEKPSL